MKPKKKSVKKPQVKKSIKKSTVKKLQPKVKKVKASALITPVAKVKAEKPVKVKAAEVDQVFVDWQAGITIAELVVRHKITRSQCRRRLTDAAGGKAKFRELRSAGAGGQAAPSGRRSPDGGRRLGDSATSTEPRVSDAGVKRLKVGATKGWPVETLWKGVIAKVKMADGIRTIPWREKVLAIYTSPKSGKRYVSARPGERADLLVNLGIGLGYARLKLYEHSRTAAKVEASVQEEQALLERGKARHKKVRAEKRAARKARKAVVKGGR